MRMPKNRENILCLVPEARERSYWLTRTPYPHIPYVRPLNYFCKIIVYLIFESPCKNLE